MGENKHTPGPWGIDASLDKRTGMNIRTADPVYDGAEKGIRICRISRVPGTRFGQMAANARLIAAAPEMLEALLAAVDSIDCAKGGDGTGECSCGYCQTRRQVQAAIRKATGGEQ